MAVKVLVDTNILVYAYERAEPQKQARALEVLDLLQSLQAGALSAQVLAEFFVSVTRKINSPLTVEQAMASVNNYLDSWVVLDLNGLTVLEAVRGVREHKFSFWDAQIWATARLNQIRTVFSEDFNSGSTVEGVGFINPLDENFAVDQFFAF